MNDQNRLVFLPAFLGAAAARHAALRERSSVTVARPMSTLRRSVTPGDLPATAILRKYVDTGAYTDCYVTEIAARVSHAEYVEAFYSTAIFKLERLILKWLVSKPSTGDDARRLARGEIEVFAAWSVEGRAPDQLLLCDYMRRTRSWLMVAPIASPGVGTRLYFGSAVVPAPDRSAKQRLGSPYDEMLGFHKLYSRILLRAARAWLARRVDTP